MDPRQLKKYRERLAGKPGWLGRWLRYCSLQTLAHNGSAEAGRLLAETLIAAAPEFRSSVRAAVRRITAPQAIESVVLVWRETRHPGLLALIRESFWLPTQCLQTRVLAALKTEQWSRIGRPLGELMESLLNSAKDPDAEIRQRACAILNAVSDRDAIDLLCDLLVRPEFAEMRKLAVEKGYAPRDPSKRALFYFMTDQKDKYEALDFDQSLLRANYTAADEAVRRAIAARIRISGRAELTKVLKGAHEKRDLSTMTGRDWETVVSVLRDSKRYADLWTLAFEAPPEWSAEALGILKQAGYRLSNASDQAVFEKLLKLRPLEGRKLRLFLPVPVCRSVLNVQHGMRSLAFAPDGKTIAVGSHDTTVVLWDVTGTRPKMSLTRKVGLALTLAFAPDGTSLAVGGVDDTARLWDTNSWQLRATLRGHHDRISAVAFSADGSRFASGSYDTSARIWDLGTNQCQAVLNGHRGAVLSIAFAPEGNLAATGSHDETVRFWYLEGGTCKSTLSGELGSVCSLSYSPDGRTLATGSSDGSLRLWHAANGELKSVLPGHKGSVMGLAFFPDGNRLVTASLDKSVRVWDLASGQLKVLLQDHTDEVPALALSPDGKLLATGSRDRTVRLWEIAYAKPLIAMTREDLRQVQKWGEALPNAQEARRWLFVAQLLQHRFRYDIELAEAAGRVLGEFDIEIAEL